MNRYDADPLTVLHADDLPVPPDPEFAAQLRAQLEASLSASATSARPEAVRPSVISRFRSRRTASTGSGARTVKLRNVAAVGVAVAVLLGAGWTWSMQQPEQGDTSAATREYKSADGISSGIVDSESAPPAPPLVAGSTMDELPASPEPPNQVPQDVTTVAPDIVTNGSLMITVAEPSQAAERLVSAVTAAGGRVDSQSEQSGASAPTVNLTLRIPPDKLDAVLGDARTLGTVESMSINHTDVTSQRVDLDARIKALQTSVDRLLELMRKAGDVADLLAAESTLTERQAELDSMRAQRDQLGDEIAYATITVNLSAEPAVERGGFVGALGDGWQSVVSAAHAVIVTVGFLLPWSPLLVLLALGLRFVVRRWRKARLASA